MWRRSIGLRSMGRRRWRIRCIRFRRRRCSWIRCSAKTPAGKLVGLRQGLKRQPGARHTRAIAKGTSEENRVEAGSTKLKRDAGEDYSVKPGPKGDAQI